MKMYTDRIINHILISKINYDSIIKHCIRKLNKEFLEDETNEEQAFGIIGGIVSEETITITNVSPLKRNYRCNESISNKMTELIKDIAIPGELNIEERGWVTDPIEFKETLDKLESENVDLIGTYHMHHDNSWYGEVPKDITSDLDKALAKDTGIFMFIVYISREGKDSIRAFYEGTKEIPISIIG